MPRPSIAARPLYLLLAIGALTALAACSPPRPTSSTRTPSTDGRVATTPLETAPPAPMR